MTARSEPRYGVGAVTATLFLLALGVKLGLTMPLDRAVAAWVAAHQSPAAMTCARFVTFFGSSPWVLGLMALVAAWGIAQGDRRGPVLLWGAWMLGGLLQIALRLAVAQWRPETALPTESMSLIQRYDLAGFPSGHAFRAGLLYGWLGRAWRRQGRWGPAQAAGVLALAVGVTRVYLGRHWLSDVVGGLMVAAVALAWVRRQEAVRRVVTP